MIKVKINEGINLAMLAKAYTSNILPKANSGEVFFSNDAEGKIENLYFKDHNYFFDTLLNSVEANMQKFLNSNGSDEWVALIHAINSYSIIDELDKIDLYHYGISVPKFSNIEIDRAILENGAAGQYEFYDALKLIYKGYKVDWWAHEKNVAIYIPFDPTVEISFESKPIVDLIILTNRKLVDMAFYRDPVRQLTVFRVEVE